MQSLLEQPREAKLRGNEFFKQKNKEAAIAYYEEAVRLCPKENTGDLAVYYHQHCCLPGSNGKFNWQLLTVTRREEKLQLKICFQNVCCFFWLQASQEQGKDKKVMMLISHR